MTQENLTSASTISAHEELQAQWLEAIANGDEDFARQLQDQLNAITSEPEISSGAAEQHTILQSELYWFGGLACHGRGPIDGPRDIL